MLGMRPPLRVSASARRISLFQPEGWVVRRSSLAGRVFGGGGHAMAHASFGAAHISGSFSHGGPRGGGGDGRRR